MVRLTSLAVGLALGLVPLVPAAAADYVIDGAHSSVIFKVKHVGASDFFGRFNDVTGTLTYDEKNPEKAQVRAVVKASVRAIDAARS